MSCYSGRKGPLTDSGDCAFLASLHFMRPQVLILRVIKTQIFGERLQDFMIDI